MLFGSSFCVMPSFRAIKNQRYQRIKEPDQDLKAAMFLIKTAMDLKIDFLDQLENRSVRKELNHLHRHKIYFDSTDCIFLDSSMLDSTSSSSCIYRD